MTNYKVCILAAGIGSRMGAMSQHVNKAILPVNFKAVISHIIEKFPKDIEIIIAIGHKKETIIDYVELAHPDRRITFVDIKDYVGPGTGPGYSLLQCKDKLQCPFVFFAVDTLVLEEVPAPDRNWFGIAPVKHSEQYCTVKIKNNLICQIDDKIKTDNKFAFIGLAGIYDYQLFFSALENNKDIIAGEVQVSNGFKSLLEKQLVPIGFTWFDTGTLRKYIETNKNFSGANVGFDFSKGNEFIYFVDDKVIKYFADTEIVRHRCQRAELLEGLCPVIDARRSNFYIYKKRSGQTLYSILNNELVKEFLSWAKQYLWRLQDIAGPQKEEFFRACLDFYFRKTQKRLQMFYEKASIVDAPGKINGETVPALKDLFARIDWKYVCAGIPATIHGDLQFDNVLVAGDKTMGKNQFVLLDWRQDFSGLVETGDLYYDLAKMYGGMILSYQLIKEGMFSFNMTGTSAFYKFFVKSDLVEAKEEYEEFLKDNHFDLQKIRVLTSLIFLNMSPLHNDPFDQLLFFMGKRMLYNTLGKVDEEKNIEIRKLQDISLQ